MKRIHKFNRRAARQLAGCMEQPLEQSWQMLHEQQQQEGPSDPPKTLEEQLSSARTDLTAAQSQVTTLTGERDTARTERDTARNEVTRLTGQFNELTTTANQLRTDLTAAQSQVTTLTGERDTARNQLTAANTNVTRLESLCGVKGVDPNQAVPAGDAPGAKTSMAEWDRKIASAKTPAEKAKLTSEFEKAFTEGRVG